MHLSKLLRVTVDFGVKGIFHVKMPLHIRIDTHHICRAVLSSVKILGCQTWSLDGTVFTGRESSPAVYHAAVTACKSFCQWNWRFRAQISTFISWQLIRAEELTESFGCWVMEWKNKRRWAPCRETQRWIKCIYIHTPDYSVNVTMCTTGND